MRPRCQRTARVHAPGRLGWLGRTEPTLPDQPAVSYLKQVLSRYRNARSYRDRGEVRVSIEQSGRTIDETAPMQIFLDGSKIWVAAYDARLWSDESQTIAWIADEQTRYHDSQVLIGGSLSAEAASGRPVLEQLLGDPILTERMTSGLGGPPPQLEWLLDANPMAKLFEDTSQNRTTHGTRSIEYDGFADSEGTRCVIVKTIDGAETYRFWIEPARSLIHRVELPVSVSGNPLQYLGWKVRSLELVLADASFEPPETPPAMSEMPLAEMPRGPKYVRSLVPLPPKEPHRRLGSRLDAFSQSDFTGKIQVTQRGVDRTMALWYRSHAKNNPESGELNLREIQSITAWLRRSNPPIDSHVRSVCLADNATAKQLSDLGLTQSGWVLVADDHAATNVPIGINAGEFALTDSQSKVLWIGAATDPASAAALAAIIPDVIAGVDVPSETRKQWESDRQAYEQKLSELRVSGLRD